MSLRTRIAAVGLALAAIGGVVGTAAAAGHPGNGCGRQFDAAVDSYLRTTAARDASGFTALLHRDVVGVLPGGTVFDGKKAMAGFITSFFARTDWTQTFDLTRKVVSNCETGYVLFDSVYAEPADGYSQKLAIGLTWTREHGRWLVLADQNTEVT
jgi:uncharacterized protein (TIGR02246 family)